MPYYDYQCGSCDQIFEVEHGMGAKVDLRCSGCGSTEVRRVFRPISFNLASGPNSADPAQAKVSSASQKSCGSCSSGVCTTCGSKG